MKCKYCGHEYSKEVIRFCPKCGKNLIDDEANNVQTEAKEEIAATATVIDNNSDSDTSKSLSKIKRGWNLFRWALSGLLVLVVLLILFEQATGIPVRDNLFGMETSTEKEIYKLARKKAKQGLRFLGSDIEVGKYKVKSVYHRGLKETYLDDYKLNLDAYIVTIPITINFEYTGRKTYKLKVCVLDYRDYDNDPDYLYEHSVDIQNGYEPVSVWEFLSLGKDASDELGTKKVYKSELGLLMLICDEIQASYDADNGDIPYEYSSYIDYYAGVNNFPYGLLDSIDTNVDILKEKFPDIM